MQISFCYWLFADLQGGPYIRFFFGIIVGGLGQGKVKVGHRLWFHIIFRIWWWSLIGEERSNEKFKSGSRYGGYGFISVSDYI